jgi:hypothetical protein
MQSLKTKLASSLLAGVLFWGIVVVASTAAVASWGPLASRVATSVPARFVPLRERIATGGPATCTSPVFTGFKSAATFSKVWVQVTGVDANDSVTNFTVRGETSNVSSTTNDAGQDICCRTTTTTVTTYSCPCIAKLNPTNGATWSAVFDEFGGSFVNFELDCEGTPAAADTIAWELWGERPQ